MDKLRELHEQIKQHPYRLSLAQEHWQSFRALLLKFSDQIWEVLIPKDENGKRQYGAHKYHNATSMLHDFNGAIISRDMRHIERCVQCVHQWLDTGELREFYTHYTGCNISPYMNRLRKYVFDDADGKYHGVYTDEEINKKVAELEADKAAAYAHSEEKGKSWEYWHASTLEYYRAEKAYHDSKKEA